ncbi:MAG: hypothetical protein J7K87_04385 [Candidatus Aenigmarchaeota archaeon]|nr:hypothetical protein [Candidatus Aenigmarchaeota archaeon]
MIFLNAKKDRCPICGNKGKQIVKRYNIRTCTVCGTVYNEFGIILMSDSMNEPNKDNIENN